MQVGRNERCPCGSGKKSKNCCGERAQQKGRPSGLIVLIAVIAIIAALGIIPGMLRGKEEKRQASLPAATAPIASMPRPQPPGPVPAGKVWSTEHGHWHDAAPAPGAPSPIKNESGPGLKTAGRPMVATANTSVPQPPGPAPAGKVWSPEHGHWHDEAPKQ